MQEVRVVYTNQSAGESMLRSWRLVHSFVVAPGVMWRVLLFFNTYSICLPLHFFQISFASYRLFSSIFPRSFSLFLRIIFPTQMLLDPIPCPRTLLISNSFVSFSFLFLITRHLSLLLELRIVSFHGDWPCTPSCLRPSFPYVFCCRFFIVIEWNALLYSSFVVISPPLNKIPVHDLFLSAAPFLFSS